MRVVILLGGIKAKSKNLDKFAQSLARGLDKNPIPTSIEILDMYQDSGKICSIYDYVIVGSEAMGTWGGKIPPVVSQFLERAGSLSGKRCLAFIPKKGLRQVKTLQALMKVMEAQGMLIKNSDIISNADSAFALGKRIILEKK